MRRRTEIIIETERTLVFAAAATAPHDYAERRCDACGAAARAVALDAEAAALFRIRPEEILRWIRATGLHVAEAGGALYICLGTPPVQVRAHPRAGRGDVTLTAGGFC